MEGGLRATKIIQCCNNISVTLSAFLSNMHLAENPRRTKLIFSFVFNTSFYYNSGADALDAVTIDNISAD